jgi:EmrB/QacA subfamily drug resistance transporter
MVDAQASRPRADPSATDPSATPAAATGIDPDTGSRSRNSQLLLFVALFGLFSTNFNVSVLAIVIPRLVHDFNAPPSTVSWLVVGPTLAYAVLGPTAGKLGDLYGRRRVYLIGLTGCCLFAGCTAAAPTAITAIAFRTASAVFGQSTAPTGMAIISEAFPPEKRVKALGYWGLTQAGGPVLGLVLGGAVIDQFGWRWIFIAQVPLTIAAFVLAFRILPQSKRLTDVRFDVTGTVLLATAAFSLMFAVNRGPLWGWTHPVVRGLFVVGPLCVVGFVLWERRIEHPLLPLHYFRNRDFTIPMITQAFCQVSYQGGFVLIPLMLSQLYGYKATRISLLTLGRPIMWGLAGPLSAWLVLRVSNRRVVLGGVLFNIAGCLLLTRIGKGTSQAEIVLLLAFAGVGVGVIVAPLMAMLTMAVGQRDLGVAAATSQMMTQIGSAGGVQLMQTIQVSRMPHDGVAGSYHWAFVAGAAVSSVAVLAAAGIRRTAPLRRSSANAESGGTPPRSVE